MRKFLMAFLIAVAPCLGFAQGTGIVTGTVTDSSSIVWGNASVTFNLLNPSGGQAINTSTGLPVTTKVFAVANLSGVFSATLTRNDNIVPYGTQWSTTICVANSEWTNKFNGDKQCQTLPGISLAASTLDISSQISASNFSSYTIAPGFQLPVSHNGSIGQPSLVGNLYYDFAQHNLMVNDPTLGYVSTNLNLQNNLYSSNLLADYLMDGGITGSGNTVTDYSGNKNNGTFITSHEPVWTATGLQFSTLSSKFEGVSLASGVNAAKTFEIAAYFDPMPSSNGQFKSNPNPLLIASTLGFPGLNLLYSGNTNGVYALGSSSGGSNKTLTTTHFVGFHVITYVLGTGGGNIDHFYIDGQEVSYSLQGSSAGFQTSGNLCIGTCNVSPFHLSSINGTVYRFRAITDQLTPERVLSDAKALAQWVAQKGVDIIPQPVNLDSAYNIIVGDSISCSWNGTQCNTSYSWTTQLTLNNQPAYTIKNFSVYGAYLQAMAISANNMGAQYCISNSGPQNALIMAGTNDLNSYSAAQTFGYLASAVANYKRAGCRVFVSTVLSHTGTCNAPGTPTCDAQKNAFNQLVTSGWKSIGADGLLDFAANPLLGADGAAANTTYFLDGVHPTAAAQTLMSAEASNSLNYFYSPYSDGNQHIVLTNTYTMVPYDDAINWAPSVTGTITLPDCKGITGRKFTITNIGVASSIAVPAGSFINGLSTSLPIAANQTINLTVTVPQYINPVCQWIAK